MMVRTFVAGAAVGVAVGAVGLAAAAPPAGTVAQAPLAAKTSVAVDKCDGGRQLRVSNRSVSSPFTLTEGPKVAVPGARVTLQGPRRGKDTLSITFSAEANLTGSTDVNLRNDWIGLEVHVDGRRIQPFNVRADVMAFAGPAGYDMRSAQFCTKIGRGRHVVKVVANLVDGANDDTLEGWLDDYLLRVERSS